jgi:hypothetical protein
LGQGGVRRLCVTVPVLAGVRAEGGARACYEEVSARPARQFYSFYIESPEIHFDTRIDSLRRRVRVRTGGRARGAGLLIASGGGDAPVGRPQTTSQRTEMSRAGSSGRSSISASTPPSHHSSPRRSNACSAGSRTCACRPHRHRHRHRHTGTQTHRHTHKLAHARARTRTHTHTQSHTYAPRRRTTPRLQRRPPHCA